MTPEGMNELVRRINLPGSFSQKQFPKLVAEVESELTAKVDWDAVYSGCEIEIYLYAFSNDRANPHAAPGREAAKLSAAMNVRPGMAAPSGAAIIASRQAFYAALVKAGVKAPAGAPTADQAIALSKRILMAWVNRGFRGQRGGYLRRAEEFCDNGQFNSVHQSNVGLQIGRGILYSVHAQDLLESIGALNAKESGALYSFHEAMFDVIREASNFRFGLPQLNHPNQMCELYSNHVAGHLMGLLSIARLLDDGRKFNAVLYGNDRSIPVDLFWTKYFSRAIYGHGDSPIQCYKNSSPDSLTSKSSFQTPVVAPGEIEDRYRHSSPAQAFGYSTGVLADFLVEADMLKNAGFDAFGYQGEHGQTIQLAADYYACFGKTPGFKKLVTAENARACPDYQEYVGQIVNGLETAVVMAAYNFPHDPLLTELDASAKAGAGVNLIDPIRFGRWRD